MAFNGRAIYDDGIFTGVAEDVSDLIAMISPYETPLLDRLSAPPRSATNVLHEWLEESLNPNTIVTSTAVASATTDTAVGVHVAGTGVGRYLQVGAVLRAKATGEFFQITVSTANTVTLSRGFGGTTATSLAAGAELFVISDAALEGSDVTVDISRPRSRKTNYCQIFKKDIIVSGTVQAVNQLGNIADEYDHQMQMRLRESIRDLEKAVIQGKTSLNTLGSDTAYRTMKGLWDHITTNVTSTGTLTPVILNNIIQGAWDQGAGDVNLIIADANWKKEIDGWNVTRTGFDRDRDDYRRKITVFEGTFGTHEVLLGRWMMQNTLMVLSTDRVHVVPLNGRSYRHEPVAKTGDSTKGMILGEYTLEVMNEEGLAKAYG